LPASSHWRGDRNKGAEGRQEGFAGMREIVLDTETTGLDPAAGHRIVEVACLELLNHIPTGRSYQSYVNPERDILPMPSQSTA
jgi:DNA polymerase III epsilon subunit-like protein